MADGLRKFKHAIFSRKTFRLGVSGVLESNSVVDFKYEPDGSKGDEAVVG